MEDLSQSNRLINDRPREIKNGGLSKFRSLTLVRTTLHRSEMVQYKNQAQVLVLLFSLRVKQRLVSLKEVKGATKPITS